jgi:hypothetical protein
VGVTRKPIERNKEFDGGNMKEKLKRPEKQFMLLPAFADNASNLKID